MSSNRHDPLFGAAPASVSLSRAPLVRVLAQLAFSPIAKIGTPDIQVVAAFQDSIRSEFPRVEREDGQVFDFSMQGQEATFQATQSTIWRFFNSERTLRVTLTIDSLTLEAGSRLYPGKETFLNTFDMLTRALHNSFDGVANMALGYRYVSQCADTTVLDNLSSYIQDELVGVASASQEWRRPVTNTLSRVTADTDEGHASWQWGLIPQGQTHDPLVMPPFDQQSWVLDIDSRSQLGAASGDFSDTTSAMKATADRAYAIFRWCVRPEFLKHYGATYDN